MRTTTPVAAELTAPTLMWISRMLQAFDDSKVQPDALHVLVGQFVTYSRGIPASEHHEAVRRIRAKLRVRVSADLAAQGLEMSQLGEIASVLGIEIIDDKAVDDHFARRTVSRGGS